MFWAIFKRDKNEKIRIIWQNKSWIKTEITENQDKIREQVVKQPSLKDNKNFLQHLLMEIRKQIGKNDSTSMSCYRILEFSNGNLGGYN